MKKRRNWLLVLFGVAVLIVFVGIGAIIAISAWVQQNVAVQERSESDAQNEFDAVRQKFGARPPLLEMRNERPAYTAGARPPETGARTSLDQMHVLVWDDDDSRLVSLSVPFWLLRLKASPIEFGSYASGFRDDGIELRVEDIERYGAGIILDAAMPDGERLLLWAQ